MVTATKPKPRCPECGSTQNYIRFTTNTHRCRSCGHECNVEPEASK